MKIAYYLLLSILLFGCQNRSDRKEVRPNILFIAVDDLRPELGCYGNKIVQSPNLDKIAAAGNLFTNHFANVPTCGASRQCLLTGMRPISQEYLGNNISARTISNKPESTDPETFIHHLRRHGYHTVGIGKISHSPDGYIYGYTEERSNVKELPHSWDELLFDSGKWGTGWNAFFGYADGENRQSMDKQVRPYEKGSVNDTGYVDGLTAQLAILKLKELKESEQPFFLGLGFFKPHLPFNSPEKYWDLYNRDSIPISPNPLLPENVSLKSLHNSGEFNGYKLGDEKASLEKPVSEAYAKKIRHAYYACISYVDQQIGYVVDELDRLGLSENTIIVVWGDHGWHLGDQQVWGKHTIFENALKSVLIVKVPGKYQSQKNSGIVETIDIYPSLMELCNIDLPHSLDGESFVPVMDNKDSQFNDLAYGYYRQGISMRTDRYRLTRYYRKEEPNVELYDHENDPYETINVALDYPQVVEKLLPLLDKGNNGVYR